VQPQYLPIIRAHAAYLRSNPTGRVLLEGHADERGSREYNLGLGERRGMSVLDLMRAEGVSASQVEVVSYGEERPVCRQTSEACWERNRRVEIVYTARCLVYQVQDLLEEVRELRGLVESQQREIENLQRRQRDQYLDLDQRLQALSALPAGGRSAAEVGGPIESPTSPSANGPSGPSGPEVVQSLPPSADVPEVRAPIDARSEIAPLAQPAVRGSRSLDTPGEEEQQAYDAAFSALRETRYADAAEGFARFLDTWPESSLAPNAQYWMAEAYYVTRDFRTALGFFNELLARYPGSSKQGDALLKIGFSHFELQQWNEARAALEQVRSEFPNTTLSRLAEGRLRDMRLAGHF
jgi:peptidoglycan-associated lipoprotein/tol-pal system protein YbgF